MIDGWRYYNHAIISTSLPHENVNMAPLEDGSIWTINKNAVLVRWTTEFDCPEETDWWYVLREGVYSAEELPTRQRKKIRRALKKCEVRKIDHVEMAEEICRVYLEAVSRYQNYNKNINVEAFIQSVKKEENDMDWWGVFLLETGELAGYMKVLRIGNVANFAVAKFSSLHLNAGISDAMYHTLLDYYLNVERVLYINSGERSISHVTNTQDYKIKKFLYRRVYCKLNVVYNPRFKWMIKLMYPFRGALKVFRKISLVDKFLSVLKMEEIVRKQEK